jgi:hypothetical protein
MSPERVERILFVMASAMGFAGASGIVKDYLRGVSILTRVGRHGTFHFDLLMKELGLECPRPGG